MSHKTRQHCDNCGGVIRQGFTDGQNLFCSQGDEEGRSCLERFANRQAGAPARERRPRK